MNSIAAAKQRLSLPQLLAQIGDSAFARKSARCPFHEPDRNASFSVFQSTDGAWLWKCHAGCGSGDGVKYLEKRFSLSTRDAITRYCAEAGLNGRSTRHAEPFTWQKC